MSRAARADRARIPKMPLTYRTGEEVLAGDWIRYASEAGTIEFVTDPENPEHAWYIQEYGGGCMLKVAPFGSLFLNAPQEEEDLEFVGRNEPAH